MDLLAPSETLRNQWVSGVSSILSEAKAAHPPNYTGEHSNGVPRGKGLSHWPAGEQYLGEFAAGEADGSGIFSWINGDVYTGEMRQGAEGGMYQGRWKGDTRHGSGIQVDGKGDRYAGRWHEGLMTGLGVWTLSDGTRRGVDYKDGYEQWTSSFPCTDRSMQVDVDRAMADAKAEAQLAGKAAAWAQSICQSAESIAAERSSATQSTLNTTAPSQFALNQSQGAFQPGATITATQAQAQAQGHAQAQQQAQAQAQAQAGQGSGAIPATQQAAATLSPAARPQHPQHPQHPQQTQPQMYQQQQQQQQPQQPSAVSPGVGTRGAARGLMAARNLTPSPGPATASGMASVSPAGMRPPRAAPRAGTPSMASMTASPQTFSPQVNPVA
ncbi:hypothetical protein T484DRAFT_1858224 [Baffinella frigidus]|nr:hypothetical protein T484DRAFT_1858224 [Cryptophyta sp. CCMP2293]